jgi:SAM-dependent methyltransferase
MKLLAREHLLKTGPVDHADWNYRPLLGQVQKLRFRLALSLLPRHPANLLEIGYGSGIFMPSLATLSPYLAGIDIHDKPEEVTRRLKAAGVNADLRTAPAEEIPFGDATFDAAVAVSSLEFVSDLDACCREIARVLRPQGTFVVITPGSSKILDLGLKILTGESAEKDFGDRRRLIRTRLSEHFSVDKIILSPPIIGRIVPLYAALRLKKIQVGNERKP